MANTPRKYLNKSASPLVLDASVVINLIATGFGSAIIAALGIPVIVVDIVVDEVESGRNNGRHDADGLAALIFDESVRVATLTDNDLERFAGLVIGSSLETLDDGEAATIAFAAGCGGTTVIDERKATRICSERFPSLICKNTIDLLAHAEVEARMGRQDLASAVYNALINARMRVAHDYIDWVLTLIGRERAASCPSLPRSKR